MSIKAGSLTFRMFRRKPGNDAELIERMAANALPAISTLSDNQIHGWVTGRHALDRNITASSAIYGGHLCVGLTVAEKLVPSTLLQAECRMEELAQLEATGQERLSAATRAEIRKSIHARLQASVPPTLRTIDVVCIGADQNLVLASCTTDTQSDAFNIAWTQASGSGLIPICMETLHPLVREWGPVSFSPELENDECDAMPDSEFLTWLWFLSEARGGMIKLPTANWALMVEGPLLMGMEGAGSHEALLRKGEPLLGAETKAALMSGKKLRRAKLSLARGDEMWTCTIDHQFTVRGLHMPDGEKLDPVSRFQTRMTQVELFCVALRELVAEFARRRGTTDWHQELQDIRQWAKDRRIRR